MSKKLIIIIGGVFLLLMFCSLVVADEITLTNGTKITCVVIARDDKSLLAETEYGTITLKKDSVALLKPGDAESNFILRGDFMDKKGKAEEAMKFYGEALLVNPKSTIAKVKYDKAHKALDEYNQKELLGYAKTLHEEPKVTQEDIEGAEAKKKLGGRAGISLQAEGSAMFPIMAKESDRDKGALQNAKMDALKKIFPNGVGLGFRTNGDKVELMPDGEFPNCKVQITKKDKTATGYKVTVQVTGPTQSVMVNLPENYPIIEETGLTKDITGKVLDEVRSRAARDATIRAIQKAVDEKIAADPKNKKKKYEGRVFLIGITNTMLTPSGYVIKAQMKIWFDPGMDS